MIVRIVERTPFVPRCQTDVYRDERIVYTSVRAPAHMHTVVPTPTHNITQTHTHFIILHLLIALLMGDKTL